MSWSKPAAMIMTVALVTVVASACSSAVKTPVSTQTPSGPPSASPTSAIAASAVPGLLLQPPPPISLPTEASVNAASSNVVWVLIQGLLFRSVDRGTSWQQRPVPPGNFPRPEISFIDDQQGWFATGGAPATQCNGAGTAVWHTRDGGNTWQQVATVDWQHQVSSGIGFFQCKEGLSFVDARHGFLGAWDPNSRPTIYGTADGGITWTATSLPDPPGFVTQAGGFTLRPGLAKGFGTTLLIPAWGETEYIFRSIDGGTNWTYLATAGQGINSVTFVTESRWLKISNDGSALETTDAGKTWHSYPSDYRDAAGVTSVFVFGDPLVGYGTVRGGIRRTVDGGLHWTLIKTPGAT